MLFVNQSAIHAEPAPLLILLHGVGSNEQDLIGLAPALDPRFFVVSARAPITLGYGAYGWYHVQFLTTGYIMDHERLRAAESWSCNSWVN